MFVDRDVGIFLRVALSLLGPVALASPSFLGRLVIVVLRLNSESLLLNLKS